MREKISVEKLLEEKRAENLRYKKSIKKTGETLAPGEFPDVVLSDIQKTHAKALLLIVLPIVVLKVFTTDLWFFAVTCFVIALISEINSFYVYLLFRNGSIIKICGNIVSVRRKSIGHKSANIIQFVDDKDTTYCVETLPNKDIERDTLITVYVDKNKAPRNTEDGLSIDNYVSICYFKDNNINLNSSDKPQTYEDLTKMNNKQD